jgi:KUP system potassium uptake protein
MGHFGKFPIRAAWFTFVLPALVLNYYGQGALLLKDPTAIQNPFYLLAPSWALIPMVVLSTAATVIASQAVISGAFSVARQAVQLGYLPRMKIVHTSHMEAGQIYVPFTNWTLYVAVMALVFGFQSSSNLAAAYGIAVTGTMMIDTILVSFVVFLAWRWNPWLAAPLLVSLLLIDLAFFSANAIKLLQGGWFPIVIALASFTTLTTWRRGRRLLFQEMGNLTMPLDQFIQSIEKTPLKQVSNTAIYLTSRPEGAPSALLHNIKHNEVLHARNVLVTVLTAEIPAVAEADRIEITDLGKTFYRVFVRYGFMEQPDIPKALEAKKRNLEQQAKAYQDYLASLTGTARQMESQARAFEKTRQALVDLASELTDFTPVDPDLTRRALALAEMHDAAAHSLRLVFEPARPTTLTVMCDVRSLN